MKNPYLAKIKGSLRLREFCLRQKIQLRGYKSTQNIKNGTTKHII